MGKLEERVLPREQAELQIQVTMGHSGTRFRLAFSQNHHTRFYKAMVVKTKTCLLGGTSPLPGEPQSTRRLFSASFDSAQSFRDRFPSGTTPRALTETRLHDVGQVVSGLGGPTISIRPTGRMIMALRVGF